MAEFCRNHDGREIFLRPPLEVVLEAVPLLPPVWLLFASQPAVTDPCPGLVTPTEGLCGPREGLDIAGVDGSVAL